MFAPVAPFLRLATARYVLGMTASPITDSTPRRVRIVIIGGGFSGIGMAIRLRQSSVDDFVILERAQASGGTWRDNSYPGCACDVQSSLYSFSFAPNPDWSRTFAPQPEIWAYLRQCVERFDLARHFVFGQEVTGARWDDTAREWTVTAPGGRWRSRFVVLAQGPLSDPALPKIAGLASFAGPAFHSAQWNHAVPLAGRRVAVIGTGASAIQFVPQIQPQVAHLTLFQRTPAWVMPRRDKAVPAWRRSLYRAVPAAQRAERAAWYALRELMFIPFRHKRVARAIEWLAKRHLAAQVSDPVLRAQLTPTYTIGCKRILVSDDYFPAVAQPNVELVTDHVREVTPSGVVTEDGRLHEADVLIYGTGFRVTDPLISSRIIGRDGRSLAEAWQGSPAAYMGTTASGFPNLFFLLGPNTGLGHNSVMLMVEAQIEHALGVLALMRTAGAEAVEPRLEAQQRWLAWVYERLAPTVWNSGGCQSWYLDRNGRNSILWPEQVGRYRRMVTRPRGEDYLFTGAGHDDAADRTPPPLRATA